jgi:hypothetical protein
MASQFCRAAPVRPVVSVDHAMFLSPLFSEVNAKRPAQTRCEARATLD